MAKQRLFNLQTLRCRFNHQLCIGKLAQFGGRRNARKQCLSLFGAEFSPADAALQTLTDAIDGAGNRLSGDVIQAHRMPRTGRHFNNAGAHGAAANHGDSELILAHSLFPAELWRAFGEEGANAFTVIVAAPGHTLEVTFDVKLLVKGVGLGKLQRFFNQPQSKSRL